MIGYQQRWLIKEYEIWPEYGMRPTIERDEPVLQCRSMENPLEYGLQDPIWSEWQDVAEVTVRD